MGSLTGGNANGLPLLQPKIMVRLNLETLYNAVMQPEFHIMYSDTFDEPCRDAKLTKSGSADSSSTSTYTSHIMKHPKKLGRKNKHKLRAMYN